MGLSVFCQNNTQEVIIFILFDRFSSFRFSSLSQMPCDMIIQQALYAIPFLVDFYVLCESKRSQMPCDMIIQKMHCGLIVSSGSIRWILWFSVRYAGAAAAGAAARREIFGVNALRGKRQQLGSPNLQDIFIGG